MLTRRVREGIAADLDQTHAGRGAVPHAGEQDNRGGYDGENESACHCAALLVADLIPCRRNSKILATPDDKVDHSGALLQRAAPTHSREMSHPDHLWSRP